MKTQRTMKLVVACAAAHLAALGGIEINADYPGGGVKVLAIDETNGVVHVAPDLRDTKGRKWMRFDFKVRGAEGRRLQFQFPDDKFAYLATLGPAISRDGGASWRWLNQDGTRHESCNSFNWTFAQDERETRFAFSIPYQQSDWDRWSAKYRGRKDVEFGVLCKSQGGKRDTELLRIHCKGRAKWLFAFTARHHASEASANPVMEGVIEEVLSDSPAANWLRENAECVFVPFMDKDGVENGEQGKHRHPHDHNRDYLEGLYTSVRAFKELLVRESNGKSIVFFDLHSPAARTRKNGSKVHDNVFTMDSFIPEKRERWLRFRNNWIELQKGGTLVYNGKYDSNKREKGREEYVANIKKGLLTSRQWVQSLPNCWMANCCEFGYSLCGGVYSVPAARELGHNLLKAAVRTVQEMAPPPASPR